MTKRAQLLRLVFLAAALLLVGCMLVISAFGIWRLRAEAIANGLETAAMHSRGFEDLLTQSLRLTAQQRPQLLQQARRQGRLTAQDEAFLRTLPAAPDDAGIAGH